MPTFTPNQRVVQVNVPANELPTVIEKPKVQPTQPVQPTAPPQPKPNTHTTLVIPFIHSPQSGI